ncbi:unnamed protein product, partial [Heterotrigona itama]
IFMAFTSTMGFSVTYLLDKDLHNNFLCFNAASVITFFVSIS